MARRCTSSYGSQSRQCCRRTTEATRDVGSQLAGGPLLEAANALLNQPSLGQRTTGRSFTGHQWARCAGCLLPFVRVTGLVHDAVPPRTLNELPDQGIDTLVDLIMLIEEQCEWPTLCNRIVFIAKAAEACDPSGCCSPSCVCSASFGESRPRCGRPWRRAVCLGAGSME